MQNSAVWKIWKQSDMFFVDYISPTLVQCMISYGQYPLQYYSNVKGREVGTVAHNFADQILAHANVCEINRERKREREERGGRIIQMI